MEKIMEKGSGNGIPIGFKQHTCTKCNHIEFVENGIKIGKCDCGNDGWNVLVGNERRETESIYNTSEEIADDTLLKGLERWICTHCGFGVTQAVGTLFSGSCPQCGGNDWEKHVGTKPLKKKRGKSKSPNLGQSSFVGENDLSGLKVSDIKILNKPKIIKKSNSELIKKKEVKQMAGKEELLKEIAKLQKAVERIPSSADKTKGLIGGKVEVDDSVVDENLVIEKADSGTGFQIYRDYNRETKFNRLKR